MKAKYQSSYTAVGLATGKMAFARMPIPAYSTAKDLVAQITALLLAAYQQSPGRGLVPEMDAVFTMHGFARPSFFCASRTKYGKTT
jgi:hypothetical protein